MTGRRREGPNDRPLRRDRVCKIAAAEVDDDVMRKQCLQGTEEYWLALLSAGYRLKAAAPGLGPGAALMTRVLHPAISTIEADLRNGEKRKHKWHAVHPQARGAHLTKLTKLTDGTNGR